MDPWFKRTYPLKHLKKWLYWPWAEYRALRDARAVLFTCEEERRLARQSFWLYKCDEFVIKLRHLRSSWAIPCSSGAPFWRSFPELAGKRCLLFLGRVHVKKGPDLLFKAFADVLGRLPAATTGDVQLVMVGPNDHAYGQEMMRLVEDLSIKNRVTWTGLLRSPLKWGAFYAAEAFVLPSHQENFGLAVAEALACGVPVLISNQVNIWREVHHDGAGLVETDDLPGTTRLLEGWLATDRNAWNAMKARALSCYQSRFQIERTADSLIKAFDIYGLMPRAVDMTSP